MPDVILEITKENFNEPVSIENPPLGKVEKSVILNALFAQYPQRKVFFKNNAITVHIPHPNKPRSTLKLQVQLENDIVYFPSSSSQRQRYEMIFGYVTENDQRVEKPRIISRPYPSNEDEPRFSVFDKEVDLKTKKGFLGKGTYGYVYPALGTLEPIKNEWIFKTHKDRILKFQFLESETEEVINNEIYFLVQTGHLNPKELLIEKNGNTYIIQARGQINLLKFLQDEKTGKGISLNLDQRYQLVINILQALKQIHERGVVSQDIKPGNILFDPVTLKVMIIDFGFAKNIIDKRKEDVCGTAEYVAPDQFLDEAVDERNDWFGIGITIAELMGKPFYNVKNLKSPFEILAERKALVNTLKGKNEEKNLELKGLFTELPIPVKKELNEDQQKIVERTLTALTATNKEKRINLDKAIEAFSAAQLEHDKALGIIDAQEKEYAETVYKKGYQIREQLKPLASPQEYLIDNLAKAIEDTKKENEYRKEAVEAYNKLMKLASQFEERLTKGEKIKPSMSNDLAIAIKEANLKLKALNKSSKIRLPLDVPKEVLLIKPKPSSNEPEQASEIKSPLEKYKDILENGLNKIDDKPYFINAFIRALGVNCLNTSSKAETLRFIFKIINTTQVFFSMMEDAETTLKSIKKAEAIKQQPRISNYILNEFADINPILPSDNFLKEYQNKITKLEKTIGFLLEKYNKKPLTLDRMSYLNQKYGNQFQEVFAEATNFPTYEEFKKTTLKKEQSQKNVAKDLPVEEHLNKLFWDLEKTIELNTKKVKLDEKDIKEIEKSTLPILHDMNKFIKKRIFEDQLLMSENKKIGLGHIDAEYKSKYIKEFIENMLKIEGQTTSFADLREETKNLILLDKLQKLIQLIHLAARTIGEYESNPESKRSQIQHNLINLFKEMKNLYLDKIPMEKREEEKIKLKNILDFQSGRIEEKMTSKLGINWGPPGEKKVGISKEHLIHLLNNLFSEKPNCFAAFQNGLKERGKALLSKEGIFGETKKLDKYYAIHNLGEEVTKIDNHPIVAADIKEKILPRLVEIIAESNKFDTLLGPGSTIASNSSQLIKEFIGSNFLTLEDIQNAPGYEDIKSYMEKKIPSLNAKSPEKRT